VTVVAKLKLQDSINYTEKEVARNVEDACEKIATFNSIRGV